MAELNNIQRLTLALAMKKEAEAEEKAIRSQVDADIMDVYAKTGAKTFDVTIENNARRMNIGTASVVTREGSWQIVDFDAFANAADDAGELETTLFIPAELNDAVYDALEAAGLADKLRVSENAKEGWQQRTSDVAGKLVWSATGEEVKGVAYVPGKTFTTIRPKPMADLRKKIVALFGVTPAALLEGGKDD